METKPVHKKEKFTLQRLLILILFVLITTILVGGVVWSSFRTTLIAQKNHIDSLDTQIEEYSEKIDLLSE